jgi:gamma-glutamylcyclotransferase (GGCT)/AIG2-like uncharacterized protein YtfP
MTLLFVYGTLKRGGSNHRYMDGQSFVASARTAPGYTLYDLSGYPGMVRQGEAAGVVGEVWSVDDKCLARLDVLECTADGMYRREAVPLEGPCGTKRVEAYIYLRGIGDRPNLGGEWTG